MAREIDWEAARSDYENGRLTLRPLAEKYGISKTYLIERRDKEHWRKPPTTNRPLNTNRSNNLQKSTPKKTCVTDARKDAFLSEFANHGIVSRACKDTGIDRSTIYLWKECDETFLVRYNLALEEAKDAIREEVRRRAHDGWDEPVYQMGLHAGTIHKYSDTLLIFHAKMLMPEYRDKQQLELSGNLNLSGGEVSIPTSKLTAGELAQLKQIGQNIKAREGMR